MSDAIIWEHQLFDGLTELQRSWLSKRVEWRTLPAKSTLYRPNDPADHFYLLLQGKIITETLDGQKNWLIREISSANSIIGLNGLFGEPLRDEFARTLRSKTVLASFSYSDLHRLMEVDFDFAKRVMHITARKALQLEQRSADYAVLSAHARFISFLIDRLEEEGQLEEEVWLYDSEVTQEEIGAYIGTGRQTVTEILADLKSKNILDYKWGKFWVRDINQLKMLNEECWAA